MQVPKAKKVPHEITQHGHVRIDNYAWLRDKNWKKFISGDLDFADKDVLTYIEAENQYKNHIMRESKETEKKLYDEILSRIKEDDSSFPTPKGDYFYYTRQEKGKNYSIYCRKKGSLNSPEEVYIDINKEAEGKELYIYGPAQTNKKNNYLAYFYNLTGSMEKTLRIRNLDEGKDLDWEIEDCTGSFLWVDDQTLYYAKRDEFSRGKEVYKLNIKEGPSSKKLIFTKPEEYSDMFLGLSETNDQKYFQIYLSSGSTQVVYTSKAGSDTFNFFTKGENNTSYSLEHYQDDFYILTNQDNAKDFKVMTCPSIQGKWDQKNWKEFLPEIKNQCIDDIVIYNDYLILEKKNNNLALNEIVVCFLKDKGLQTIKMPGEAYDLAFEGSWDHLSTKVRLKFDSPINAVQTLELDLKTFKLEKLHEKEIPNYDSSKYQVKREFAKARDGAEIPLTIISSKDFVKDGNGHALVYSYGSYGLGYPAHFSSTLFSLVDRGFIYCIAHIRGGDEKGHEWYLDGKMHKKMNTFHDFIDSCEYLIKERYTSAKKMAINGGSAGGLLMGAVTNMRPDLFGAVVADVAFVDVINTISDASLPLTPPEWEEWGNPIESKEDYDYMMQYSPYDNVKAQNYPPTLYNSGISDEQVTYWEPAKMVAKLRELKTDNNPLLLNMKMHAGHAGASKKYEWVEEKAFDYAFILKSLDLK